MSMASSSSSAGESSSSDNTFPLKFVDIGANLLDERFTRGEYYGKIRHAPDVRQVLERASDVGVRRIIVTAGTLEDSRAALAMCRQINNANKSSSSSSSSSSSPTQTNCQLYCTVGVHPTRCNEFVGTDNDNNDSHAQQHLESLLEIVRDGMRDGTVVAIGEVGLDYDRLQFCSKDVQRTYFELQFQLLTEATTTTATPLPLFVHNRNVGTDVYDILKRNMDKWQTTTTTTTNGGGGGIVVHSFDDTWELARAFLQLGDNVYIGLNGCSLKTLENLEVVKQLPLDRIVLETDCPYCQIKQTHAGYEYVKTHFPTKREKQCSSEEIPKTCIRGRTEPCQIIQVAEVIAGVRGISVEELSNACYNNSLRLYGWQKD